jgi:hypothetical protein
VNRDDRPAPRNRKDNNFTQDDGKLRRFKRRWTVDRTINWFQNFRRLRHPLRKSITLFIHWWST